MQVGTEYIIAAGNSCSRQQKKCVGMQTETEHVIIFMGNSCRRQALDRSTLDVRWNLGDKNAPVVQTPWKANIETTHPSTESDHLLHRLHG